MSIRRRHRRHLPAKPLDTFAEGPQRFNVTRLVLFKQTLGQLSAMFVVTKKRYFKLEVSCVVWQEIQEHQRDPGTSPAVFST